MFCHNLIRLLITSLILSIGGCLPVFAPDDYLPSTDDVPKASYGGWFRIIASSVEEKTYEYNGEFIALDSDCVYILYDSLLSIRKDYIESALLQIDEKNTAEYGLWTVGGCVSTISNGAFLIITAPLWIIGGTSAASGESFRDTYQSDYPDSAYWFDVNKFARFPQGLPENVSKNNLKMNKIISAEE